MKLRQQSEVLQDLDFLARRDDFLVGQAIRLSPPAGAGVWLRLCCFVLQDLDFLARCDDFLVGQAVSPVTAGWNRRLVAAMLLCGTGVQPVEGFWTGLLGQA
jgi:hypothetical protein